MLPSPKLTTSPSSITKPDPAHYHACDGAICGQDQGRFFNRPLYIANTRAFALAGDRPIVRFAGGDTLHGTFLLGIVRAGRLRWLHDLKHCRSEYRSAHFLWSVSDPALPALTVTFEVTALGQDVGFAARVQVAGARAGDQLVWAYGGAKTWPKKHLNWDLDPHSGVDLIPHPFDPKLCQNNHAQAYRGGFTLAASRAARFVTHGRCSLPTTPIVMAADELNQLGTRSTSTRKRTSPLIAGCVALSAQFEATWSFLRVSTRAGHAKAKNSDPAKQFATGLARSAALASRVAVDTPDEQLNTLAAALGAAVDGAWYPPVFRHGSMLWNNRYPGWRTVFGGTITGWHQRVRAQAEFYFAQQVQEDDKQSRKADPAVLLTIPAKDSRFYGRGRIVTDQGIYNMQSQMFDQMIHAWRWTGDADLEAILRPALELHLEWIRECFDPDGDGLYESVINVWPTDSVWHGGGGSTEETAYAYRGHTAARDLARRAGDAAAVRRHTRILTRIRKAFQNKLWIKAKGHAGLYREQSGLKRLHEDAWLYSIFLPVDAGLVDTDQAAQSLYYSEWALQNDLSPNGGRRVWTSNFVPGIWSVRVNWPGDNHHLALAYYKAGLAREGWDVFRGNFEHTAFYGKVPGDFGASAGGTDFGDSTSMFARTLVEGLFGFTPDYPNNLVSITPQFPEDWDHARIQTPDVGLRFRRDGNTFTLEVNLTREAPLEINLPLCAHAITSVTAEGRPVAWQAQPGFGCTLVQVKLPTTRHTIIEVTTTALAPIFEPHAIVAHPDRPVVLRAKQATITAFSDPQGVFTQAELQAGKLIGTVGHQTGFHTVQACVTFGTLPQWRLFRVQIKPTPPSRPLSLKRIPAHVAWECLDLQPVLNGDIRTIFQQEYLSPRPETISARMGTDGYTSWTFVYWDCPVPIIALDAVPGMLEGSANERLRTPQGVPFAWPGEARNVAFTSHWDNWPDRVTVPVNRRGDAVWFLICGSTNPMQGRIANAVLRLHYADGVEEKIELVPPINYWNLCPMPVGGLAPGQTSRADYTEPMDTFCLPAVLPPTVQLGENCRAMLLHQILRPGVVLKHVTLETLSAEVVVGLMGVTVMGR